MPPINWGLAYTPQSAYADKINTENWHTILARPDVLFGLSDPRFDACGYRGLMATQLAERYCGDDLIFGQGVRPATHSAHPRADAGWHRYHRRAGGAPTGRAERAGDARVEGQAVMAEDEHPMILLPVVDHSESLPDALQPLIH